MFTIGADPEIFLKKAGKPASAYGVIPGTKTEPHPVDDGAIQVDGMAVEFNINPVPYNSFNRFNENIVNVMKQLKDYVKATNNSYSFLIEPTQEFGQEFLDSQPEKAKELGCDPDFSAYTLKENPVPDGTRTFRTAAGHLHIGWGAGIPVDNQEHIEICADLVKDLDATVGMFMTYIDRNPLRRELYGKAGAFRPKPYGVEYRTPSNVWLRQKDFRECVFKLMQIVLDGKRCYGKTYHDESTQGIIDGGRHEIAVGIVDRYLAFYPAWSRVKTHMKRTEK